MMLEPVDGYLLRELANLRFKLRGMSTGLKAFDQQDKDKKQKQEIDRGLEAEQVGCGIHNAWKNADYQNQQGDDCPENRILYLHL